MILLILYNNHPSNSNHKTSPHREVFIIASKYNLLFLDGKQIIQRLTHRWVSKYLVAQRSIG